MSMSAHNQPLTCADNAWMACANCPLNTLTNPVSPSDWHESGTRKGRCPLIKRDPDQRSSPGPSLGPLARRRLCSRPRALTLPRPPTPIFPTGRCDGALDRYSRPLAVMTQVARASCVEEPENTSGRRAPQGRGSEVYRLSRAAGIAWWCSSQPAQSLSWRRGPTPAVLAGERRCRIQEGAGGRWSRQTAGARSRPGRRPRYGWPRPPATGLAMDDPIGSGSRPERFALHSGGDSGTSPQASLRRAGSTGRTR